MSVVSRFRKRLRWLESAYHLTESVFRRLDPLFSRIGYDRAGRLVRPVEAMGKRLLFDCRMCGQCILHSTGMTCSMTCPKNVRNGPCGGVRANGHCEVESERLCTWVEAYERSLGMPVHGHEIRTIQPPVNRRLESTSAWVNMLTGLDQSSPRGWAG